MEWLQTLLDNSTTPALTAFLLGLLTAISPCPLATNIAAVGYISKDIKIADASSEMECFIPLDASLPIPSSVSC